VACRQSPRESVSITFLDPEWSHDTSERKELMDIALQQFMYETGIRVRHLPAPESVEDQLALARQMLEKGTADVYSIDVVWPGILKDNLFDLGPEFASEMSAEDPELIANLRFRTAWWRFRSIPTLAFSSTGPTCFENTDSALRQKPGTN